MISEQKLRQQRIKTYKYIQEHGAVIRLVENYFGDNDPDYKTYRGIEIVLFNNGERQVLLTSYTPALTESELYTSLVSDLAQAEAYSQRLCGEALPFLVSVMFGQSGDLGLYIEKVANLFDKQSLHIDNDVDKLAYSMYRGQKLGSIPV